MKRKVQLYIAGQQVDLGDDSWILYNWTREDMANPTAVVNSSSHQISIPGTCRNNAVFGAAFRLDRRTLFGIRYDGTFFDPTRKTPFMLYDSDGTVLESGYCRLDEVNTHSRRHAYTVTLYGGLGSYFYSLASKDDGTPRTLADLIWSDMDGEDVTDFGIFPGPETVQDAWAYLAGETPTMKSWWNCVNFAPCYNGIPSDFDASHALMNNEAYANMPTGMDEDDQRVYEYTYKAGLDCALVSFTNPHTEWELGDLRWYLQRPAVSVKAFIAAVCDPRNNGGYTVTLDATFFNDDNPAYASAWWTLAMIATEDRVNNPDCITNVLKASKTPMDYLVSYCKIYGLMFMWDSARHKVSIVTRATFYSDGSNVLDMSGRIDRGQEIRQDPVLADKRWYQLGDGGKGEFVENYAKDYGKGYGVQRIDTGYEFDAGTKVLTDGLAFQDAAEVTESDLLFSEASRILNGREWLRYFQLPRYEKVTFELWNDSGESKSYDMACDMEATYWDVPGSPGLDWLPKLQAHGADNKAQDGANVLLYFSGIKDTPAYSSGSWNVHKSYFLTGDDGAMTDLAGGPCWDMRRSGIQIVTLPSFRRVWLSGRYITESYEWGAPAVRPVPNISYPSGKPTAIYDRWWKRYLADRYAADTRVLTCRADLRGLPVGQALLRRFYWYDNALWTLNAIRNHSLTSHDLTECEFVKVNDKAAYTQGPGSALTQYLIITPDAAGFNLNPSGETLALEVKSSSPWTLTTPTVGGWLTFNTTSGLTGTTTLEITATANSSGGRRSTTVTLTNTEGETLTINLQQNNKAQQSISLNPASITIPATGTTVEGQASRGRSCRVDATDAWDVDATTIPSWLTVIKSVSGLTLKAGANSGAARTASVKVYLTGDTSVYANLSVTQEEGTGGTGGITLTDGQGNTSATVQASGGSLTLVLTIPDGADWTLTPSESWVSVSPVSGSGNNSQIAVTIPNYTGSSDRNATITAKRSGYTEGAVFYIIQAAPAASADYVELVKYPNNGFWNSDEIQASGVQGWAVSVQAVGSWRCETPNPWIHPSYISSDPWSGSGYATIYFAADANTGAPRTGTIVATCLSTGETSTFYIYQDGNGTVTLDASFSKTSIDSSAQEVYLSVVTQSGVAWSIDQISSGLSLSRTSGTGPATITVQVNSTSVQRTLSARVRSTAYGLSVTPSMTQQAPSASDYLRVTPFGTVNVSATTTSVSFQVQSNASWTVSKASGDTDVSISPSSGSGNATVTVSFPVSIRNTARTIPITFSGVSTQVVNIVQAAGEGGMDVTVVPQVVNIAGNGDAVFVTLGSTGDWTASKSDSWISVSPTSGSSGQGQTLTISASRNTGAARTGTVTVSCGNISRTITVNQATDSELLVSSNAVELGAASGSEAVVTVYASGMWELDEYSNIWVDAIYTAHAGDPDGEALTFRTKQANTSGASRSETIRVRLVDNQNVYQEIVVTQISDSTLYVSPTAAQVGNGVGTGFINVRSNTSWHITSIDEGLTIAAAAQSGTGNKDVMYAYTANPDEEVRRCRVYFATDDGKKTAMFTLIQAAATDPIIIEPDSPLVFTASQDESQSILTATRVVTCTAEWTAASSDGWLSFTPSSGLANVPTTVTFTARASLTEILHATWTVTRGDKTKSLSAICTPPPVEL